MSAKRASGWSSACVVPAMADTRELAARFISIPFMCISQVVVVSVGVTGLNSPQRISSRLWLRHSGICSLCRSDELRRKSNEHDRGGHTPIPVSAVSDYSQLV